MDAPPQPAGASSPEDTFELPMGRLKYWAATAKSYGPRPAEMLKPVRYGRNLRLVKRLRDEEYTGVGVGRARILLELAREAERREVPGAIVDCGVWNGGSTILLGVGAPDREIWAFDSFEGLPKPGPRDPDAHAGWEGTVRGSEKKLEAGFGAYAGDGGRLHVVKGWFEDTLMKASEEVGEIAILHIDADWYSSVKLALEAFYDNVVPDGVIAIDDFTTWQGARDATNEFRQARGVTEPLRRGHYWRKR